MSYDSSPIGDVRRAAIRRLDLFRCTPEEQRSAFGVSQATFYRYAVDMTLLRRSSTLPTPGCNFDKAIHRSQVADKEWLTKQQAIELAKPDDEGLAQVMPMKDAREIAILGALRTGKFETKTVIAAFIQSKISKTAVYDLAKLVRDCPYRETEVEVRWREIRISWQTHSINYQSRVYRARERRWRHERWVTRRRSFGS